MRYYDIPGYKDFESTEFIEADIPAQFIYSVTYQDYVLDAIEWCENNLLNEEWLCTFISYWDAKIEKLAPKMYFTDKNSATLFKLWWG
jgi:hypothetical protein